MDENISHAVALMGATLLFMVAFSLSVVFYNGLEERADEFFEATSLGGRQEDATAIILDRNEIKRKITFQEVYMAILNLPTYVAGAGNDTSTKIIVNGHSGNEATYTASFDIENNIRKISVEAYSNDRVIRDSYFVGMKNDTNPLHAELEDLNELIQVFSAIVVEGADTRGTSNDVLRNHSEKIKNTTFSISYSGDAIVYTLN